MLPYDVFRRALRVLDSYKDSHLSRVFSIIYIYITIMLLISLRFNLLRHRHRDLINLKEKPCLGSCLFLVK